MSNEKLLINDPKSNNSEDMRNKQIESTDWLTRGIPKEQLERERQEAIMSADLELCHTEFQTGVGEIYTDYDTTAQKMVAKGYRKQSEGEWVNKSEDRVEFYEYTYQCSLCGYYMIICAEEDANFCPECGAKMKGADNE